MQEIDNRDNDGSKSNPPHSSGSQRAGGRIQGTGGATLTAAIHHYGQRKPPTCSMEDRKDSNLRGQAIFVKGECTLGHPATSRYGAHQCGALSNTVNLILRLFLYHFLHRMSSWHCESVHNNTNSNNHHHHGDGATCPSSGVDSMNTRCLSGGQPCTCVVRGRCQRVLLELIN
jgi:hypothetical protein